MKTICFGALFLLAPLASAAAAEGKSWLESRPAAEEGSGRAWCDALVEVEPPQRDRPTPAEAASLDAGCDSIALYEGIGHAPDYRKARLCAYVERGTSGDEEETADPFSGSGVLMLIYANGKGVPRNLPLARQFACHVAFASDYELDLRQQHLAAIVAGEAPAEIHICDDSLTDMMGTMCAGNQSRIDDARRAERFDTLAKGLPPAARNALLDLRKTASAFADSSGYQEQDMHGTGAQAFALMRSESISAAFETQARDFVAGKFPKGAGDPKADAKLNATYRRVLAEFSKPDLPGTESPEGIRETQRLWLRYRDAWLAFSRALHPEQDTAALLRALTTLRTKQLDDIGEDEY